MSGDPAESVCDGADAQVQRLIEERDGLLEDAANLRTVYHAAMTRVLILTAERDELIEERDELIEERACHAGTAAAWKAASWTLREERDALLVENERMRHELEVMYGGAFDRPAGETGQ